MEFMLFLPLSFWNNSILELSGATSKVRVNPHSQGHGEVCLSWSKPGGPSMWGGLMQAVGSRVGGGGHPWGQRGAGDWGWGARALVGGGSISRGKGY